MDLDALMQNTGLIPTQKEVFAGNIDDYAEKMRNGTWDWTRTASDPRSPMIVDKSGNIIAGHHRFIAAQVAGIKIPDGVIKTIVSSGGRVPRPWNNVIVRPDFKP